MATIYDSKQQIVCISKSGHAGQWHVKDSKGEHSDRHQTDDSIVTIDVSGLTGPFELWLTSKSPDNLPAFSDLTPAFSILNDIQASDVVVVSGPATYDGHSSHISSPTDISIFKG